MKKKGRRKAFLQIQQAIDSVKQISNRASKLIKRFKKKKAKKLEELIEDEQRT